MANTDWPVNFVAVVATVAIVSWASPAAGHPEYQPNSISHYLKIDLVTPSEVRLAYTVMVGPTPATALRQRADANHDGKLDAAETRALGDGIRAATLAGITLEADGKKITPAFGDPDVGLAGGDTVAANPFSVDLVARLPLGAGPATHTLRFDDATEPLLGETEIRIDESPTTKLIAAHRGPTGNEREARILFRGPKFSALEDRSVTVVFGPGSHAATPVAATAAPPARWGGRLISFVVFFVLAALLTVTALRRRRR